MVLPPGRNHSNLLVLKSRKNHLLISLMRFDSSFCTSGPVVVGRMDGWTGLTNVWQWRQSNRRRRRTYAATCHIRQAHNGRLASTGFWWLSGILQSPTRSANNAATRCLQPCGAEHIPRMLLLSVPFPSLPPGNALHW